MYLTYFFISKSLEVWNSVHALQWWNMEFHLHLGCVCFEWKWFLEILFCKCGCLVVHEKYIFRKCFLVWPCVGCKMIFVFILLSNIIFRKTERERENESEIAPVRKERERERAHHRRPTSFDFAGDPETSRHEPTNQSSTLLANPEPRSCHEHRAFDLEPEPSTHRSSTQSLRPTSLQLYRRPRAFDFTGNPRTDLSLSVRFWFLCDFDFCCCCGGVGGGGEFCVVGGEK